LVLQIGFGVNNGVGEMRMRLFNAEDPRDFIHELFFVFAVDSLDLRIFERFFTQFEDGHLLQILPIHTILRSSLSNQVWYGAILITKSSIAKPDTVDDVLEGKRIRAEIILRRDADEIVDLTVGSDR